MIVVVTHAVVVGDRGELLEAAFEPDHGRSDVAPLVREHGHPDAPTSVQRTEEVVGGELDVGEEDLVELRVARHLAQRADLDPGQVHREQEEADAVVLAGGPL